MIMNLINLKIPGNVIFSLDIRARSNEMLHEIEDAIRLSFAEIAKSDGSNVHWNLDAQSSAVQFHDHAINCIREACEAMFQEDTDETISPLISGAGHDSVFTHRIAPTAMAFVPCRNGLSHHPEEYCNADDCAIGAQIIMDSLLRFDGYR